MKNWIKILGVLTLFIGLVGVRYFESSFYDPLISFFERDYLHTKLPELNQSKLILNIGIRYAINTILSLAIIWVAFQNKSYLKFSAFFYLIAFVTLLLVFVVLLRTAAENQYLALFYVRRFLIQPLFVLLLLPAFYYSQVKSD